MSRGECKPLKGSRDDEEDPDGDLFSGSWPAVGFKMGKGTAAGLLGGAAEMGMGCAMDEMVLAVADMTLGSLQTVLGEATSAMM